MIKNENKELDFDAIEYENDNVPALVIVFSALVVAAISVVGILLIV